MRILTMTYRGANCYLLQTADGWLMFDAGWPDSHHYFQRFLKENGLTAADLKYLIVSHFHPDHAGLVQLIKDNGAQLLLHECQASGIDAINTFFKKERNTVYQEIDKHGVKAVSSPNSRMLLKSMGIDGEIIATPGHSADSISLVLDNSCAFAGDLPAYELAAAYADPVIDASWSMIQSYQVKKIYPAHGNAYNLI